MDKPVFDPKRFEGKSAEEAAEVAQAIVAEWLAAQPRWYAQKGNGKHPWYIRPYNIGGDSHTVCVVDFQPLNKK
ncbi:MAG: hypothetical protein EBZ49_00340 [Proteobacteria bacterium]|nr:hypothetical protein [Pseudomonadota bacterium]